MKIRKTKKLLKLRKQAVEISVKDWDIEDGNKALVTMDCAFKFNKSGVTVVCCDISCEFIPYWQIGHMTREEAIAKAEKHGLQAEVIYCMDKLGYSPEEACDEWGF